MRQFDWPIAKKRVETIECLPPWPTYIGEDFGQNMWDESEMLLGTPLGNTLRT